jgi:hypothetical protein
MLSKASVSGDLRLPGVFGALIGESLHIFALITVREADLQHRRGMLFLQRCCHEVSLFLGLFYFETGSFVSIMNRIVPSRVFFLQILLEWFILFFNISGKMRVP